MYDLTADGRALAPLTSLLTSPLNWTKYCLQHGADGKMVSLPLKPGKAAPHLSATFYFYYYFVLFI